MGKKRIHLEKVSTRSGIELGSSCLAVRTPGQLVVTGKSMQQFLR